MITRWMLIKGLIAFKVGFCAIYLTDCVIENYGARAFTSEYPGAEHVKGISTFMYGYRIRQHILNNTISIFSGQFNVFTCPNTDINDQVLWKFNNITFDYPYPHYGNRSYPYATVFALSPAEASDSGLYQCYVDNKLHGSAVIEVIMKSKVLVAVFFGYLVVLAIAIGLNVYFGKMLFCCPRKRCQSHSSSNATTENTDENISESNCPQPIPLCSIEESPL
uniref:Ig-like domain-containing protein n=1 Tax=Panagrellus redivivus TaxID=6233 RepID=A0A7E4W5S2_PANRE